MVLGRSSEFHGAGLLLAEYSHARKKRQQANRHHQVHAGSPCSHKQFRPSPVPIRSPTSPPSLGILHLIFSTVPSTIQHGRMMSDTVTCGYLAICGGLLLIHSYSCHKWTLMGKYATTYLPKRSWQLTGLPNHTVLTRTHVE